MNRPIKFRAWNEKRKEMINISELILYGTSGKYKLNDDIDSAYDNWPLMQFTGLLDKNGKEVYEGDILEYSNENSSRQSGKVFTVEWGSYVNCMGFNITDRGRKNGVERTGKYEIIGNIYENPEFLK